MKSFGHWSSVNGQWPLLLLLACLSCETTSGAGEATVTLSDFPPECATVAIRFTRRVPYHGNLAMWKPVENGEVRVKLGPEFAPHRYGVDAIHIECRNADGGIVRMFDNREPIHIGRGENAIDRGQFSMR